MQHLEWTSTGRTFVRPGTRQRVWKGYLGQRNIQLPDGTWAPYVWDADTRTLRYGDVEAHFGDGEVSFYVDGERKATTRPRLQQRRDGVWVDVKTTARIERLDDEDSARGWACARIAIVLNASGVAARHIVVAGGRSRARGDTKVTARRAGTYRLVVDHDTGSPALAQDVGCGAVGRVAANGWRVAWTAPEDAQRTVRETPHGLVVEMPQVVRRRHQPERSQWISPDTYGPTAVAGSHDDSMSDIAGNYSSTGSLAGAPYTNALYVDDSDIAQDCIGLRWTPNLGGYPASIDSGTQIVFDRTSGTTDGGSGHTVRFACQAIPSAATGADTTGDAGRPAQRFYFLNAYDDFAADNDQSDLTCPVRVSMLGPHVSGYAYTGSEGVMFGIGAGDLWGITAVSWLHMGYDDSHASGSVPELTVVYTTGGTQPDAYFHTMGAVAVGTTSLSIPFPTGISAGDLLVMQITNKYPTNAPSAPGGIWVAASNNQGSGGSGSSGNDTGSVYETIYYGEAAGSESGSQSITITSGNAAQGRIYLFKRTAGTGTWSVAMCQGSDNSAGTSCSFTGNADPGITAGDLVLGFAGFNTDAYTYSAQDISATGISAWSDVLKLTDAGTTSGQDCASVMSIHRAVTGTSSAAPVYTMTASGTTTNRPAGAAVMVRVRVTASADVVDPFGMSGFFGA